MDPPSLDVSPTRKFRPQVTHPGGLGSKRLGRFRSLSWARDAGWETLGTDSSVRSYWWGQSGESAQCFWLFPAHCASFGFLSLTIFFS